MRSVADRPAMRRTSGRLALNTFSTIRKRDERPLPRKAVRIPEPFSDGLFRYADTFMRSADEDFFFQPRTCLIVCCQMLFDGFDQVVRQ